MAISTAKILTVTASPLGFHDGTMARNMLCSGGGPAFFRSPADCRGDCHVAWNDTRHHPDHFPAGGVQWAVRGLRLRHGPLRDGPWRRHSDSADHLAAARQALGQTSY